MNVIKRSIKLALLASVGFSAGANAQSPSQNTAEAPAFVFLVSGSPSSDIDFSQVYGAELQVNWRLQEGFAVGFHGLIQNQEYGPIDINRWGLGLSLNYYFNFQSVKPYVGIKRTYYGDLGDDQEALDCLYCSNVSESYDGGETFATVGLNMNRWTMQLDYRLSDEGSTWSTAAYDPWGVGPTWNDSYEGVPDPEVIFSVGYAW